MSNLRGHFNSLINSLCQRGDLLRQRCDLFHLGPSVWHRNRPVKKLFAIPAVSVSKEPPLADHEVQRLLTAYRASEPESYYAEESMWQQFFGSRLGKLHEIFMRGSIPEARRELANPGTNQLFYGFDNIFFDFTQQMRWESHQQREFAQICLSELLTLAEAFGVLRCENPEAGEWRNSRLTSDAVIDRLDTAFGVGIEFPNPYPLEYGVATRRGVASYRSVHALYQALRARQLLQKLEVPCVLEVGAGLGRGAFYALRFSPMRYDIVDLPFTMLSQGYFLMSTLGAEKVRLAGEPYLTTPGCVNLLLPDEFLNGEQRYDLVINVDSFPEINRRNAQQYWNKIENCSNSFFSINHEFNELTVKELYKDSPRIQSVTRHPSWMRRGYVEELIVF
jgi:hypothetical protein